MTQSTNQSEIHILRPLRSNETADKLPLGELGAYAGATEVFNSAITAFAIPAAWSCGLLDVLAVEGSVSLSGFVVAHDLHEPTVRAIAHALASRRIVRIVDEEVQQGIEFDSFYQTKGFFTWLLSGCGEMLRRSGAVARSSGRQSGFIQRDGAEIGTGTGDFGRQFIDPVFRRAVSRTSATMVADLGCGTAERLVDLIKSTPGLQGLGIDISKEAVEQANERVKAAGLEDRLRVVQGDARSVLALPEFAEVDLVTSFLMGHDFWPRERCLRVLEQIAEAFPKAREFLLCDTYRSALPPGVEPPMLTQGFEYMHALMGQYIPSLEEWRGLFQASVWQCDEEFDTTLPPYTKIFLLRRRAHGPV